MVLGVDYSFARPGAAAIKAAGYQFVCRYLASSSGKRITLAEANDLHNNGLSIALVFEDTANQALNGRGQGVVDAQIALSQANAIGFPTNRPIYFAVDFDATPAQQASIDAYLSGAASIIGASRVGVYGGFYVVQRCAANNSANWFWQAVAWSGGQQFSGNHIYQNGQSAFAGGADIDEAKQSDFGQWPIGGGATVLTKEEIIVIYTLAFDNNDVDVPADIIKAYTGKPLDGLLTQLASDPSYLAHKKAVNTPPAPPSVKKLGPGYYEV